MQSLIKFSVMGLASRSVVATIEVPTEDLDKDLLTILRLKYLPIASSCSGQGACHKCVINDCERSCLISAREFYNRHGNEIYVSYL